MVDINKQKSESELQYIWRLCLAKDSGSLKMTWDELASILNKNLREDKTKYYDSSAYRKQYQYARRYRDEVFSKEESDDYMKKLEQAKRELEKERIKVRTEKLEYNRWKREEARDEMLLEQINTAIASLCPLEVPVKIPEAPNNKGHLLNFGDMHYGVEFKIRGLYGEILNEYSPEICEQRMWDLQEQVVDIIKREDISTLHILNLSDNIDGILRMSQLMKLRFGVVDATIKVAEFLSVWLNELSKHVRIKYYMALDSNHDELRLLNGKKGTFPDDNMDRIIFSFIKERLKDNPNIEVIENNTNLAFMNICGYNIAGIHGEVKDMKTALQDYSQIYGVQFHHLIGAHIHHNKAEEVAMDCSVINIGSIIGIDSHSVKLRKTSNASAKLLCFEEGKDITIEYNIKLN